LHKVLAAVLAVPVLAALYVSTLVRRSIAARAAFALMLGLAVAASGQLGSSAGVGAAAPRSVAVPDASAFASVSTSESPNAPVRITFPTPMDPTSVAASLTVRPAAGVDLSWDQSGTVLTVTPVVPWAASVYHTITVAAGALDASGRPTSTPTRAAFLTRPAATASISAVDRVGDEAAIASSIAIEFSRPIDDSTLDLQVDPPVDGQLVVVDRAGAPTGYLFEPADPLDPGTTYTVWLSPGLVDLDGAPVATPGRVEITTASAPAVVRFRPRDKTTDVVISQALSVRFTEPMDEASTAAAWSATIDGAALAGTISFAESHTVLVFKPKAALPRGKTVVMSVAATAVSQAGVPLERAASATFTTVPKPTSTTTAITRPSSVGAGTWAAVETYYLKLMNCTRTGGWVTSTGACSSPGGRNVAPLWIDAGISSKVSRPYAKKLAVNNMCTHFSGGNPGDRLRAAGYTSYIWAENLGCRSGDPFKAVLGSHLFFQSEKSYSGGHYVNLMNAKYDRVGIGVWVASGRVRLVIDFYHPR
jgi:uncharacterized protein YkwD